MSEQERKRQRVSDLISAGTDPKMVANIVGVSLATVYNVKKAAKGGNGVSRKEGSGGNGKKRDEAFLEGLQQSVDQDPTKSIRRLATELGTSKDTVHRAISSDLGLKSFARTPRHLLTNTMKKRRLERCKKVLCYLKSHGSTVKIFSDKKIFTVDQVYNRRNDRFIAKSIEEVKGIYRTKHPAQIMVLGVVASDGRKMPPYFFPPGEKVGADEYYRVLRYTVLPWLKANYPSGNYVWTQDGAPPHTAKKNQNFCRTNFADFWPADMWPSSSPDLNPLDFAIWGVLEKATNATPHPNLESLKTSIKREWDKMSSDFVSRSCRSFRTRVEAVIDADGGHIEN